MPPTVLRFARKTYTARITQIMDPPMARRRINDLFTNMFSGYCGSKGILFSKCLKS